MKICSFMLVMGTLLVMMASGWPVEQTNKMVLKQGPVLPRGKVHDNRKKNSTSHQNSTVTSKAIPLVFSSFTKANPFNSFYCKACKAAIDILRYQIKTGRESNINLIVDNACVLFNIQTPSVCHGIANLFGPELVPILNSTLNALVVCSFLLTQDCIKVDLPCWRTPLPPAPKKKLPDLEPPPKDGPKLKVLHITDTHYDKYYTEGAKTYCLEPLCCRAENGMAAENERGAGKWGDWNCDIPERTLDSMLQHAAQKFTDLDYIIWTGDVPPHDIWKQSKDSNLEVLKSTASKFKKYFPKTPIYSTIGNHETAPSDLFPPPNASKSNSWLYDELDNIWRQWLPENTSETIKYGAYYTTLIRPKFRIVSLNTNYCYYRNWWLMLNSTDPAGQLKWLAGVLHKAETNQEKVHIIGHIAPGQSDCLPTWRDNYYRIVARFRNTITNHFFGHSHKDEFELYFDDKDKSKVVGVGFLGPSATTYTNLNPGYRVYYIDGDRENSTRAVLDYENWVLDLKRSNRNKDAKWGKSYSAKQEYQMESLLPKDWYKLYESMKTSDTLFDLYYRHSHKDSPLINPQSCNDTCKRNILCNIKSCLKYG